MNLVLRHLSPQSEYKLWLLLHHLLLLLCLFHLHLRVLLLLLHQLLLQVKLLGLKMIKYFFNSLSSCIFTSEWLEAAFFLRFNWWIKFHNKGTSCSSRTTLSHHYKQAQRDVNETNKYNSKLSIWGCSIVRRYLPLSTVTVNTYTLIVKPRHFFAKLLVRKP